MNHEDFVYFILEKNTNPAYSFSGYTNQADQMLMQIFKGRKENLRGVPTDIPHRWKFDEAHRSIRVHKNDKSIIPTKVYDKDGKEKMVYIKSVDFLRGYPECKDSPNGNGQWMFREMKDATDAKLAISAKKIQNEAQTIALNLEGGEIREMGALYGQFGTDNGIIQHFLIEKAGAEPQAFLDIYNSPERSAKALLRKAVSLGIVRVKGSLHNWADETLGHNEDAAVAKLIGNDDMLKALRENVKTMGK
jgi:hypothetical protein